MEIERVFFDVDTIDYDTFEENEGNITVDEFLGKVLDVKEKHKDVVLCIDSPLVYFFAEVELTEEKLKVKRQDTLETLRATLSFQNIYVKDLEEKIKELENEI